MMKMKMNGKGFALIEALATIIIIAIIVGIVFGGIYWSFNWNYGNEQQVTCTVDDKWIKRSDEKDIYLVSCDEKVYKITDLFYKGKFDSSNIYAKLKKGKKYKLTVTGYRNGYFSSYQNINEAVEVSK